MGHAAVVPNFENCAYEELRIAQRRGLTQKAYRRCEALELMYRGYETVEVADIMGVHLRTVQRWIHLFNAQGVDALLDKGEGGRPRIISKEEFRSEFVPLILDPSLAGEVHWTIVKFQGSLTAKLQKEISCTTVRRYFRENDFRLLVPRRWPEQGDEQKRAQFIEKVKRLRKDSSVELWFGDECGIEGDPRPRRRWAKRGSRPKLPYTNSHLRCHVIGAVQPDTGKAFALTMPHSDTEIFQIFLNQFAAAHPKRKDKQIVLVLDNASWHKAKRLNWQHIKPLYLSPYSPDLNPIEVLWLNLKNEFFKDWYAKTLEQLTDRVCQGLAALITSSRRIKRMCTFTPFQ